MKLFTDSLDFLRQVFKRHNKIFWFMVFGFIYGCILGYFLPAEFKHKLFVGIAEKFSSFNTDSDALLAKDIFLNNTKATLLDMVMGFFLVVPFLITVFNGIILGVIWDVAQRMNQLNNFSVVSLLASLIPHSVLELPVSFFVSFMATLAGLKLIFKKFIMPSMTRRRFIFEVWKSYVIICIPLLFIAALIESFLTPRIANLTVKTPSVIENAALQEKFLTDKDVTKLDMGNLKIVDAIQLSKKDKAESFTELAIVLFDNDLWPEVQKLGEATYSSKSVVNENNEELLAITIYEFNNSQDPQTVKKALLEGQKKINQDKQGRMVLTQLDGNGLVIVKDDVSRFYFSDVKDKYLVIIGSSHFNIEDFKKITGLQMAKLQ